MHIHTYFYIVYRRYTCMLFLIFLNSLRYYLISYLLSRWLISLLIYLPAAYASCPSIYLFVSTYLPIHEPANSACIQLIMYPPTYLPTYPPMHLIIIHYPSTFLSIYPPAGLPDLPGRPINQRNGSSSHLERLGQGSRVVAKAVDELPAWRARRGAGAAATQRGGNQRWES